ncbi:MAG: hypothetical protein ACTTK0_05455 [Stomatobaculum sp.]
MNRREKDGLRKILLELKEERRSASAAAEEDTGYDISRLQELRTALEELKEDMEQRLPDSGDEARYSAKGEMEEDEIFMMEEALDLLDEALVIAAQDAEEAGGEALRELSAIISDAVEELWDIL